MRAFFKSKAHTVFNLIIRHALDKLSHCHYKCTSEFQSEWTQICVIFNMNPSCGWKSLPWSAHFIKSQMIWSHTVFQKRVQTSILLKKLYASVQARSLGQRSGSMGFNIVWAFVDARNPDLLLANNKGTDLPAHPCSLISAFFIHYLKSKITRSDIF